MHDKFKQKVSLFKNTFDKTPAIVELAVILEKMKTSSLIQHLCAELRRIKDDDERLSFKQNKLPAFTVSGAFRNGHASRNLICHNGLIQIDFDGKNFSPSNDLDEIIERLKKDPYTYIGFTSPSGTGYKLIVQIEPDATSHKLYFMSLEKYYWIKLGLKIDTSCKDLGRLCFLSYDPFIYINEEAQVFKFADTQSKGILSPKKKDLNDHLEIQIEGIVRQVEAREIDMTDNYHSEWLKLCFALADGLGERGRQFFHRISIFSTKYNPKIADTQFDKCLKGRKEGITIRSFFGVAKAYGINIYPNQFKKIG